MKIEPNTMPAEVKVNGEWIVIEELLTFAEHERNAATLGATEVRSLDGRLHRFLNGAFKQSRQTENRP
jgi:hypothetical protein